MTGEVCSFGVFFVGFASGFAGGMLAVVGLLSLLLAFFLVWRRWSLARLWWVLTSNDEGPTAVRRAA